MILSIIVLLDVFAALSAFLGLANFFDTAQVLSKIVLNGDKSPDDDEESFSNREFYGRTENNNINRELVKTTNGNDQEIEAGSFFAGGDQSDLIYLMNSTAEGELMDPGGEVTIQRQKNFDQIF